MVLEDYDALCEMLKEFGQEAEEINSQIERNQIRIKEAEAHLNALKNLEPDDVKVFSPRKAEILYKEEIEKIGQEKYLCEKQNQDLYGRKALLENRIKGLTCILNRQIHTPQMEQYEAFIEELEELVQKIQKSSMSIDKNPMQSRQDFAIIVRCLQNLADRMRDSVG